MVRYYLAISHPYCRLWSFGNVRDWVFLIGTILVVDQVDFRLSASVEATAFTVAYRLFLPVIRGTGQC